MIFRNPLNLSLPSFSCWTAAINSTIASTLSLYWRKNIFRFNDVLESKSVTSDDANGLGSLDLLSWDAITFWQKRFSISLKFMFLGTKVGSSHWISFHNEWLACEEVTLHQLSFFILDRGFGMLEANAWLRIGTVACPKALLTVFLFIPGKGGGGGGAIPCPERGGGSGGWLEQFGGGGGGGIERLELCGGGGGGGIERLELFGGGGGGGIERLELFGGGGGGGIERLALFGRGGGGGIERLALFGGGGGGGIERLLELGVCTEGGLVQFVRTLEFILDWAEEHFWISLFCSCLFKYLSFTDFLKDCIVCVETLRVETFSKDNKSISVVAAPLLSKCLKDNFSNVDQTVSL